jgi:sulfur relay (sulfurtransferase) DsrC/TusE family protein
MELLVFYTANENLDILVHPMHYELDKSLKEAYERFSYSHPNMKDFEYDIVEESVLPDIKYKDGLKGSKAEGVWLDDEKYFKNSDIKAKTIEKLKNETADELSKTDYKVLKYVEGHLSNDEYESMKVIRQKRRDKYNNIETKIIKAKTIAEFEEIVNGQ